MKRRRTALLLSLLQALPFQIRKFFDQLFHLLVVLNRFPDAPCPLPRHKQLAQLSPLSSNQVQAGVELSPSAVTTGFAAPDVSQGEGAAEKTSLVNDLCQTGATSPLAIGELRALHGASHLLYTIVYKNNSLSRAKTRMRICHWDSRKGNSMRKRNLPYRKIADAESLRKSKGFRSIVGRSVKHSGDVQEIAFELLAAGRVGGFLNQCAEDGFEEAVVLDEGRPVTGGKCGLDGALRGGGEGFGAGGGDGGGWGGRGGKGGGGGGNRERGGGGGEGGGEPPANSKLSRGR